MKISKKFLHPLYRNAEHGKVGYALLWLLGIPLPVLVIIYFLRGCN